MKNPCYDTVTHKDCPRRCSGCAVGCPDWQAYIIERTKDYDKRKQLSQSAGDYAEHIKESSRRFSNGHKLRKIGGEQ